MNASKSKTRLRQKNWTPVAVVVLTEAPKRLMQEQSVRFFANLVMHPFRRGGCRGLRLSRFLSDLLRRFQDRGVSLFPNRRASMARHSKKQPGYYSGEIKCSTEGSRSCFCSLPWLPNCFGDDSPATLSKNVPIQRSQTLKKAPKLTRIFVWWLSWCVTLLNPLNNQWRDSQGGILSCPVCPAILIMESYDMKATKIIGLRGTKMIIILRQVNCRIASNGWKAKIAHGDGLTDLWCPAWKYLNTGCQCMKRCVQ